MSNTDEIISFLRNPNFDFSKLSSSNQLFLITAYENYRKHLINKIAHDLFPADERAREVFQTACDKDSIQIPTQDRYFQHTKTNSA